MTVNEFAGIVVLLIVGIFGNSKHDVRKNIDWWYSVVFYSVRQPTESEDSAEAWETVTAERERWVRMAHHLEVLVLLSDVIGVGAMRAIPPVPSVVVGEEEEEGRVVNILDHQVQLLQNGEGLLIPSLPDGTFVTMENTHCCKMKCGVRTSISPLR